MRRAVEMCIEFIIAIGIEASIENMFETESPTAQPDCPTHMSR